MASGIRDDSEFFLIGSSKERISETRLPSCMEVIRSLLHFHFVLKIPVRESAEKTVDDVMNIWKRARIPTRQKCHCISQLIGIYDQWVGVKRHKSRRTDAQIKKENVFVELLQTLFDIAHLDALELITVKTDRDFLIEQRAGRKRCIEADKRLDDNSDPDYKPPPFSKLRKLKDVITPELAAALDRAKVSDRMAMHIISATAVSLGHDVSELVLSVASIKRAREKYRAVLANNTKIEFLADMRDVNGPWTVHWDGKLLPDVTGKDKVDRLPILVSGQEVDQLLAVPKLLNGTGEAMATAIHNALQDWNIDKHVRAMCFDTTASNTGKLAGACTLLEHKLGRRLLSFACRHHILEIVLEKACSISLNIPSTGPDIGIFKRFQSVWSSIDQTQFRTGISDATVAAYISEDVRQEVLAFALQKLEESQPRNDYRELLSLTVVFLGGTPPGGVRFRAPAGLHRARWMARLIYGFKLFMFGRKAAVDGLFKLSTSEERGLIQLLCFSIAGGYIQAWFSAPEGISAPRNDLDFLDRLLRYSKIDNTVSTVAISKFLGHLWYLSEELIAFSFFDPLVPIQEKRDMLNALNSKSGSLNPSRRINLTDSDLEKALKPSLFVTTQTLAFFNILQIPTEFLRKDPELWNEDDDYETGQRVARSLKVVNDVAERGVALIQDFNEHFTRNEEQKQYVLQVISEHRKIFPDAKKQTVISALTK
jgi:hypothetical protein